MILTRRKFFFGCAGIVAASSLMRIKPERGILVFRGTEWQPWPQQFMSKLFLSTPGNYIGTLQLSHVKALPLQAKASDFRVGELVTVGFDAISQTFKIIDLKELK